MGAVEVHVIVHPDCLVGDEAGHTSMHRADEAGEGSGLLRLNALPAAPRALLGWRRTCGGDQVGPSCTQRK